MSGQGVRAVAAELLGTAVLVYADTSIAVAAATRGPGAGDLLADVLLAGLILAGLVAALGHLSGCHLNPAITVGLASIGRFPWRYAGPYVAAQLAGSLLGTLTTWGFYGDRARSAAGLGATIPAPHVPDWRAFLVEAVATFVLALVAVPVITDRRVPSAVAPVAAGFTLAVAIFVAAPLTGGAVNPARAFGPDVVSGHLGPLWIYLIAPPIGGVLAAVLYERVLAQTGPPAS